jgi:hypothetical protein
MAAGFAEQAPRHRSVGRGASDPARPPDQVTADATASGTVLASGVPQRGSRTGAALRALGRRVKSGCGAQVVGAYVDEACGRIDDVMGRDRAVIGAGLALAVANTAAADGAEPQALCAECTWSRLLLSRFRRWRQK